jgi:hypothetical protein
MERERTYMFFFPKGDLKESAWQLTFSPSEAYVDIKRQSA